MIIKLLLLLSIVKQIIGEDLFNCPEHRIKFEKIIGLRPTAEGRFLHRDFQNAPVTTECARRCSENKNCASFVLLFSSSECYWLENSQPYQEVVDFGTAWFSKICLQVETEKLWAVERTPGAILLSEPTKTILEQVSRVACHQFCLNETSFRCKSANFHLTNDSTKGTCSLRRTDRHTLSNAYRISSWDDEYLENQCHNETKICAYEEYENAILAHSDLLHENITRKQCQVLCDENAAFNCRGYSLIPLNKIIFVQKESKFDCLLHSEDSKLYGPKLLIETKGAIYYEKAPCLNVSVECSDKFIIITYFPTSNFGGKIYMQGYSENSNCYTLGDENKPVKLNVTLINGQCGIMEAKSSSNRTLLSGSLILQHNRLIQTQGDRLIKVGCIFDNDTQIVIGTGINFNNTFPNRGTALLNISSTLPRVQMRIVDLYDQNEVTDSQIGQELQLIVEIIPPDGPFDIRAGHLVAMTERGDDSILLLDDRGCPTNLQIFPALKKIRTNGTNKLIGNFQAFKFTSSPLVRFSAMVQFCAENCPKVTCGLNNKKKRSLEISNATKILTINREQFNEGFQEEIPLEFVLIVRNGDAYPDRLIVGDKRVLIAGYDFTTNEVCIDYSLFIGLIITWVLLQVILVTCAAFLVRRYKRYYEHEFSRQSMEELHKNFGLGFSNLEHRHVHWADTSDLT